MINITNGRLSATINEFGAELNSLKNLEKGKEYIWQGDPAYWEGHAPILFPAVGRVFEDKYSYNGKEYMMPKHGFASTKSFKSKRLDDSSVELTLIQDEETKSMYPFIYSFSILFSISDDSLNVRFNVENKGDSPMFTSVGFHPAFNVEMGTEVEFNKDEKSVIFYRGETPVTDKNYSFKENRILEIDNHTFDEDKTIAVENPKSTQVLLKDKTGRVFLKHEFGKNTVVWIWSISGAPYVCIEPWSGSMERFSIRELEKKKGIIKIDPGKAFVSESIISVH
ncbi:MAG: hypothetical protein K6F14_03470 [Clostridiales bacterium]|nr:hypothetical protein [Clostridiales bacterium]